MITRSKPRASSTARSYLALLRGINVGGRNTIPMADLKEIFIKAGGADVQTYIQSGNVVFSATPITARSIAGAVPQTIKKRFGFQPLVIIRSASDVARIVAANPFSDVDVSHRTLLVGFLAETPNIKSLAHLDPARSPGDSFEVIGQEIFLHLPTGSKSKFTYAYFESTLSTQGTFRNWRTVLKINELMHRQKH